MRALALEVVRGHSVASCEAQVAREAKRVAALLEPGFKVLHLMANRARERTIVGVWRGSAGFSDGVCSSECRSGDVSDARSDAGV